jgi:hypothetical protein
MLVVPGNLSRPSLNIVSCVRWRPGPCDEWKVVHRLLMIGIVTCQCSKKLNIFSKPTLQDMQQTFSFCGAVSLLSRASPRLRVLVVQVLGRQLERLVLLDLVWFSVDGLADSFQVAGSHLGLYMTCTIQCALQTNALQYLEQLLDSF